jgi:hypothetical protein
MPTLVDVDTGEIASPNEAQIGTTIGTTIGKTIGETIGTTIGRRRWAADRKTRMEASKSARKGARR